MASYIDKLYNLGSHDTKRSTLSYANTHRDHHVLQEVFELLLKEVLKNAPWHSFLFSNDIYSIDATTIDLCLSMFDWASFREKKGGIKIHRQRKSLHVSWYFGDYLGQLCRTKKLRLQP